MCVLCLRSCPTAGAAADAGNKTPNSPGVASQKNSHSREETTLLDTKPLEVLQTSQNVNGGKSAQKAAEMSTGANKLHQGTKALKEIVPARGISPGCLPLRHSQRALFAAGATALNFFL